MTGKMISRNALGARTSRWHITEQEAALEGQGCDHGPRICTFANRQVGQGISARYPVQPHARGSPAGSGVRHYHLLLRFQSVGAKEQAQSCAIGVSAVGGMGAALDGDGSDDPWRPFPILPCGEPGQRVGAAL